ncbi:MAG: DUF3276 family protein [Bacteroidales bacterium]|nr:DUF3276 family protein [Bacteroidales bacterium]
MEGIEKKERIESNFSRAIRAGKRTYFFDIKTTKSGEYYLTITESKRRFNTYEDKFYYEKHKIFLYREDFEKFKNGFEDVIEFVNNEEDSILEADGNRFIEDNIGNISHEDIKFDDFNS